MNKLKKIVIGFWAVVILIPSLVYAVQITVPSAPGNGYMLISTTTGAYIATTTSGINVGWINGTSTTASIFPYASTTGMTSTQTSFFATASGAVGVGTTSIPTAGSVKLDVASVGDTPIRVMTTGCSHSAGIEFGQRALSLDVVPFLIGQMSDCTNNEKRLFIGGASNVTLTKANLLSLAIMTFDSSNKNVGIGTTTPTPIYELAVASNGTKGGLYVGGTVYASSTILFPNLTAFTSGDSAVCQTSTGLLSVDTGVTSCIVSTKTAKHDIVNSEATSSLDRIMKLNPVAFEYNVGNKPDIGLIAEEVAAVDPRYAQYDPKTLKPKAINWAAITSDLIKTTQDQEVRIEALEKANGFTSFAKSLLPTVLVAGAGGVYLSRKKKIT